MLASDPDDLAGDVVEASVLEKSAKAKENYHIFGTLDGVLTEKSYISVHEMRSESGECTGYLSSARRATGWWSSARSSSRTSPLGLSDAAGGQRPHQGDDA